MPGMKVVLHLGAHKTASTYLQARLSKSINPLRQMQVGYVDLKSFRDVIYRAGGLRRCQHRFAMLSQRALRSALSNLIRREQVLGVERVVLSDENILGNLSELSDAHKFYLNAGPRLRAVTDALRDWDVELALSVRDYTTFLPSVWGHMAMRQGYRRFNPNVARPFLTGGRGWAELVQDIQRAAPGVPLNLWTYETFAEVEDLVLDILAGPVSHAAIEPIRWQAMAGLSAVAVARIEDRVREGQTVSQELVLKIAERYSKATGHLPYAPWSEDVATALSARYATDLARIGRIKEVMQIGTQPIQRAA